MLRCHKDMLPMCPLDAMAYGTWEFTPCDRITHICSCKICTRHKEHCLVAEALGNKQESSAWKNCNCYKQDLINLGWTLAHEGGIVPPPKANFLTLSAFNKVLQCCSHQLTSQLEAIHQLNTELTKELECECLNISLRAGKANFWQDQYQYLQERY
jgi:hypothetical protein